MNESVKETPDAMRREVLEGLQKPQKTISSKYFYDERGSELFEKITRQPEYYPTRTEQSIMRTHIDEIADTIGPGAVLVEPGSGSSKKTRLLLDHLPDMTAYVPVEIARQYLARVVQELRREYPALLIKPVCADYTRSFQLPDIEKPFDYYVVFYPGSTIGNFRPEEAQEFLAMWADFMVPGGGLLIGVDLKKDPQILEAAYNDSAGVTAAFNKNMLTHLNRELKADFKVEQFGHRAFYNESEGRIEMHLVSRQPQTVTLGGESIRFDEGETIHTENSYKYAPEEFEELVSDWFEVKKVWTDADQLFSVQYLVRK